jgi:adenine-specific DNA-methyltransferase
VDAVRRRALGAYYTPSNASSWMAQWILRDGTVNVLEPSSGDGSFVDALLEVAHANGLHTEIHAVEIDPHALSVAANREGVTQIHSDFHELTPFPVDAVIGNPPFVRFRHLPEDQAAAALRAGQQAIGAPVDASGSTWMTFAIHATSFLRAGGSLALVLPSDALYVRYAKPFWAFMAGRFGSLQVIRCRERIFPDLLQDVVLLLADRAGSTTDEIDSAVYEHIEELTEGGPGAQTRVKITELTSGTRPFVRALLSTEYRESFKEIESRTVPATTYAKFNIGYVAGDKNYFHPTGEAQRDFALRNEHLIPAISSGRLLAGSGLRTSSLPDSSIARLWLPDVSRLTEGEERYVSTGEAAGVHNGYKTSRREPWFVVPGVKVPDLLLQVFGSLPKLMLNDSGLVASNSLLAGYWQNEVSWDAFALSWYSTPTRLGVELAVHSLGGGVLVLVPREADSIRMPIVSDVPPSANAMEALDSCLRARDILGAYEIGDAYLTRCGWSRDLLGAARQMADTLMAWRLNR